MGDVGVRVLVVGAGGVWLGGAAGLLGGASAMVLLLVAVGSSLVATAGIHGHDRYVVVLGLVVLAGCGSLVAVLRVAPLAGGALPEAAQARGYVSAEVVLDSDPAPREGAVRGSYRTPDGLVAAATVRWWSRAGVARDDAVPIRLGWTGPREDAGLGAVLHVRGLLAPGDPVRRSAAYLTADEVTVVADPAAPLRVAQAVRDALAAAVSGIGGDGADLLPGLVLGDTSRVGDELDQAMKDAGLSHLTAVSGGNVAITLTMLWFFARRVGLRRRARLLLGCAALPAYILLVRPDPSVVRAGAMAAIGLIAALSGRRGRGLAVLACAVIAVLLLDPFLALSVGLGLSVASTAALILVAGGRKRGLLGTLTAAWAASAAASLAAAPLIAGIGGGVPLLSVPANLLAEPAVAPASVVGLLAALVGVLHPPTAALLAHVASVPSGWIAAVARRCADVPGAVLPWPSGAAGTAGLTVVVVLVALAWWAARRSARGGPVLVATGVVGVLVLVWPAAGLPVPFSPWPPPGWVLVACDVGQGDGLVVSVGDGAAVVVDTGPDPPAMDRCLSRLGVRTVPLLVLSHQHADHVEGVPGVLRSGRDVGQILVSPLADPVTEDARVRRWAADASVPLRAAAAGETITVGTATLTVLWPTRLLRGTDSDPNNASVVLLVRTRGISLLLGGDVEPEAQSALLREAPPGHVDVVKIPHHGSARQDPGYATSTTPEIAVVSVGVDNDYGHPAAPTLRQYEAVGATVGRTDTMGDLAVVVGAGPELYSRGK